MKQLNDATAWVTAIIRESTDSSENALRDGSQEKAWGTPLVGFSSGDDPIYADYKDHVGPFHWTPVEAFRQVHPGVQVNPDELTVICWVLPQTEITKADNREQTVFPAERWARTRVTGEEVNNELRRHVARSLNNAGHEAVAPMLAPQWTTKLSDRYGRASTWSERHAAHASGLGTFGLCDGLITPLGKAMRVGSVVARIQIPPTARTYTDHRAYCLFFARGTCGKCIDRCPVGAITEKGHDKDKCSQHLNRTREFVTTTYGFEGYGCGLCQTGVPCESRIPMKGSS